MNLYDIFFFSYRSRDEIQDVRQKRDPITGFKERLIQAGLATEEELKVRASIERMYFLALAA